MSLSGENEGAQEAVTAFEAANEKAVDGSRQLIEAWRLHHGGAGPAPSAETIAEVAHSQQKCQQALELACHAVQEFSSAGPESVLSEAAWLEGEPVPRRKHRRRRSETKLLRKLGSRGQRLLRAVLLVVLACTAMVTATAAISLALEIAGFLRLIDEPVQLPLGIQLVSFTVGCVAFIGLRRVLKGVDRSLYGSKGRPAQTFPL